jgi:flagellar basal-body rod modification protein FlgD
VATTEAINSLVANNTSQGAGRKDNAQELNDRFLKLLVAQMNNQDPLNPMDNAQLTSQMAQINTVTGINGVNDTVSKLIEQFSQMQAMQAAQLTGRDVLVDGNVMTLAENGAGQGGFALPANASNVAVEVRDANGALVRTINLGPKGEGIQRFSWDGKTDAGAQAKAGKYSFSITAKSGATAIAASTLTAGRVEGVRQDGTNVQLVLTGLDAVSYSDIKQIL